MISAINNSPKNPFLRGFFNMFDISQESVRIVDVKILSSHEFISDECARQNDAEAILSDYIQVGNDLRESMDKHK